MAKFRNMLGDNAVTYNNLYAISPGAVPDFFLEYW